MRFLLILFLTISTFAIGQNKYCIKINLRYANGEKVYLSNAWGGPLSRNQAVHTDSVLCINDTCSFFGQFKNSSYYSIALGSADNFAPFIIDTGIITITGNAKEYLWKSMVAISPQNNWGMEAAIHVDSIEKKREAFQDSLFKYENKNKKQTLEYANLMNIADRDMAMFLKNFVKGRPDCYYAFLTLKQIYYHTKEATDLTKEAYPYFSERIKNSDECKELYNKLFLKNVTISTGDTFPRVLSYNVNKKYEEIILKKNIIYLVDYWASWCVPCVQNLPKLKEFERQFRKKKFRLISISIDNNYQNWINGIKSHNIYWTNYCSLDGFHSADVKLFNINAIPFMILINGDGKIVKLNPTDEEVKIYLLKL